MRYGFLSWEASSPSGSGQLGDALHGEARKLRSPRENRETPSFVSARITCSYIIVDTQHWWQSSREDPPLSPYEFHNVDSPVSAHTLSFSLRFFSSLLCSCPLLPPPLFFFSSSLHRVSTTVHSLPFARKRREKFARFHWRQSRGVPAIVFPKWNKSSRCSLFLR